MRRVPLPHSLLGSPLKKSISLSLGIWLGAFQTLPAFARDDDRFSYSSNRSLEFQNQNRPNRNFSPSSQLDRQIQNQNAAMQFRFGQRPEPKLSPTFTPSLNRAPTLPQPKFQFGTATPKPIETLKINTPKPQAESRLENKGIVAAIGNLIKPVGKAFAMAFQKVGQAVGKVAQFFAVDRAKIAATFQRDQVLKQNPDIREVSKGVFQVPQGQTAPHGGRTWESGTTFMAGPDGNGIQLVEGVSFSPDLGGIKRADGNPLPVKMIGENGGFKPVGIDFARIEPKTDFNITHTLKMDGLGDIPAGAKMTFEGFKPGTREDPTPSAILSFQNAQIDNPQGQFQSVGRGKEPLTLAQAEMKLKGAIYQINGLYLNKGQEKLYSSRHGELFSVTQLEGKSSSVQKTTSDLSNQSQKLTADITGAVNHSNALMDSLHKHTGTPATLRFQIKEPIQEQGEIAKTLKTQTDTLKHHMENGQYGEVANAVTNLEATQNALGDQIKGQQAQLATFQDYKRAVKGLEQAYGRMAGQADPESMKASNVTPENIKNGSPYFQAEKIEIRVESTKALTAIKAMREQGIFSQEQATVMILEVAAVSKCLLAAKPDLVGTAAIKTADTLEKKYQAVSKDFDEAIFDHLDRAAENHPSAMLIVGQGALAVAGGAAIVGLGYGIAVAPATTVVVVGSGVISQKTFEAMGLSPEAAAFYTAILLTPASVAAGKSQSLQNADKSVLSGARNSLAKLGTWMRGEAQGAWRLVTNQRGHVGVGRGETEATTAILGTRIQTPYGVAQQENSPEALAALKSVKEGVALFRKGSVEEQAHAGAQYWSLKNPITIESYEFKMGMPPSTLKGEQTEFIMMGKLKPGAEVVTRKAPGLGVNRGGDMEAVVNPGTVESQWFHVLEKRK